MDFYGSDHVYECIPPVLGNEKSPEPCVIGLKVITVPELDKEVLEGRGLAPEMLEKRTRDMIRSKVTFIRNLKVDDQEVADFDTFYAKAPPELVRWVCRAVYSTQVLSEAERKNS